MWDSNKDRTIIVLSTLKKGKQSFFSTVLEQWLVSFFFFICSINREHEYFYVKNREDEYFPWDFSSSWSPFNFPVTVLWLLSLSLSLSFSLARSSVVKSILIDAILIQSFTAAAAAAAELLLSFDLLSPLLFRETFHSLEEKGRERRRDKAVAKRRERGRER